jgi:hypothetical protein
MGLWIAIGIFAVVAIVLYLRSGNANIRGDDPESELRHLCRGDTAQVERLIDLEARKSPGISRGAAVSRAIHAIRRDNS